MIIANRRFRYFCYPKIAVERGALAGRRDMQAVATVRKGG